MKKTKNYLGWLLLAIIPVLGFGQSNYKQPLNIDKEGMITDAGGITIGSVSKDKIIKDHHGHKIAFVDGQGNLVDAKTGEKKGKVGNNGKSYYNASGELYLTVKDNGETCEIFKASGKKIGNVHSSYKGMAGVLHCFDKPRPSPSKNGDVAANDYACPMHPEITGTKGESCSRCHMKLVKK